jgi:hypothetical protein
MSWTSWVIGYAVVYLTLGYSDKEQEVAVKGCVDTFSNAIKFNVMD